MEIQFCLLGPLLVLDGVVVVPLPPGKQRTVLASLLLNAGQVVSLGELAEILWGASPPSSARVTTQNYVMRLRKALGSAGSRISTRPRGYLIHADASELDVCRFQAHLDAAGTAAGLHSWQTASAEARKGLALWRGEPLADVESELLAARDVPRLSELRTRALEIRIDADLHLGRHGELITELRQLAGANPLRERLHGMLMLALYRDGRQAEALAAYQHARGVIIEELGVEPGPDLRDLHRQILSADPALAIARPAPPAVPQPPRTVPRELPSAVPGFTGRSAELEALTRLLDAHRAGAIVISAIGGTAGVGKTALAVYWAHQVAGRFPDGQLYVNLRGYDPGQPMPAADALAGFLRSLGVAGQDIPPEEHERAARYRSLLAGKQILVVLDNAGSAGQVRPLLPGTGTCAVVVTSRDALAGLVARDGAARLDLDVLPLADAVALLCTLIGTRAAESGAAAELAAQCCRLPLALRVAAELAAARSVVPLAGLVSELADLHTRLDLLESAEDPWSQVRVVFSWSYRHLDTDAARAFRLLALHPGPDLEPYAGAALTGASVPRTRRALDALARAHLIQPAGPGRYGMHDLLRAYARELAASMDPRDEQDAALTRLFDYYLHTAATAMDILYPAESQRRPRVPEPASPVPPLAGPAASREWLAAERATVVAVAAHTAAHGWPGHAARLATTLTSYLYDFGLHPEALTIFGYALDASRRTGDHVAEATALTQIGDSEWQQSRLQQAGDHHRQALALFRAEGDRAGEAQALSGIGLSETMLGRYEQAARLQQEATAIYHDIGDRCGEARAIANLGWARRRQGRFQEATGYYRQSLDLYREIGDVRGEAVTLARLGSVDLYLGRYEDAARYHQRALATFHELGDRSAEAETLVSLGQIYLRLGRYEQAGRNFEQALATFRDIGDPALEADALNGLGDLLLQTGDAGKARLHHAAALERASEIGAPLEQANAHSGLARACHADGNLAMARRHLQEALTRYAAIGAPEAGEIRALLAMPADADDKPADDKPADDKPTEKDDGTTAFAPW